MISTGHGAVHKTLRATLPMATMAEGVDNGQHPALHRHIPSGQPKGVTCPVPSLMVFQNQFGYPGQVVGGLGYALPPFSACRRMIFHSWADNGPGLNRI
jgi:hypothetical protein